MKGLSNRWLFIIFILLAHNLAFSGDTGELPDISNKERKEERLSSHKPFSKLAQLVEETNFEKITEPEDVRLGSILESLVPKDRAYITVSILHYSNMESVDKIKALYLEAAELGSELAIEQLILAALHGQLGFEAKEGRKYLEKLAEKNPYAKECLIVAAIYGQLDFTEEEGEAYLREHENEAKQLVQKNKIAQSLLSGSLSSTHSDKIKRLKQGGEVADFVPLTLGELVLGKLSSLMRYY